MLSHELEVLSFFLLLPVYLKRGSECFSFFRRVGLNMKRVSGTNSWRCRVIKYTSWKLSMHCLQLNENWNPYMQFLTVCLLTYCTQCLFIWVCTKWSLPPLACSHEFLRFITKLFLAVRNQKTSPTLQTAIIWLHPRGEGLIRVNNILLRTNNETPTVLFVTSCTLKNSNQITYRLLRCKKIKSLRRVKNYQRVTSLFSVPYNCTNP